MPSANDKKAQGLKALLGELDDEIEAERVADMVPHQRVMEDLAKEILRLERDMTIPGSPLPDSTRIERLTRFIEDKDF